MFYDIINFILLTIIVALIIHIILKNIGFNKNTNDFYTTQNYQPINEDAMYINNSSYNKIKNDDDEIKTNDDKIVLDDNTQTNTNTLLNDNILFNDNSTELNDNKIELNEKTELDDSKIELDNNEQLDENPEFELLVGNTTWQNQYDNGIISANDKYTDDFFNEYVFYGRNSIGKSNLSKKGKLNYRDNYYSFRDNVWTMPNHDNDAVDIINDITLAENEGQLNVNQNKSIKDVYDSMTQKNYS